MVLKTTIAVSPGKEKRRASDAKTHFESKHEGACREAESFLPRGQREDGELLSASFLLHALTELNRLLIEPCWRRGSHYRR